LKAIQILAKITCSKLIQLFTGLNLERYVFTNYVSLLFMAQRKKVWLEQEEIFGDLFVSRHA
jgi:chromatin segregation and condensation protein Rec8/ScpA/Scc1 (kleisin family)